MENLYIKTTDKFWDQQDYLMEGVREVLYYENYESFSEKLWDLTVWVTSQPTKFPDETIVNEIVDQTINLVKGAHFFLHHKERIQDKIIYPEGYSLYQEIGACGEEYDNTSPAETSN